MIYILQFDRPLGNDRHRASFYIGFCEDAPGSLDDRVARHRAGRGAAMTRFAVANGIGFKVAWSGPGSRDDERRMKNQKSTSRVLARLLKRGTQQGETLPAVVEKFAKAMAEVPF